MSVAKSETHIMIHMYICTGSLEHSGRTQQEVDAGVTGVTGVTGRAVQHKHLDIPDLLSASFASAWKGLLGVKLKPFTLLTDPTPNPVLFLSFLPDS